MQTARRRRTTWAIAASALAHAAVLVAVLLQRHTLPSPLNLGPGPASAIIPVVLTPRPHQASASPPPTALPLHRPAQSPDEHRVPAAPSPSATARAPPLSDQAASSALASTPGPAAPDLRAALRHGVIGCANAGAGLSHTEREHCNEQLGRGVASAPFMPAPIEPRIRAYYDAVALAKKPDPPPVPLRAQGSLGRFDIDLRGTGGHQPAIGCKIYFGPGEKPKKLPHALYLGPCFIEPPKGPLDPEVDITPP
jgi:hypothetical protein